MQIVGASACVIFILHQRIQKMAKCTFWYQLTWVVPDKVQRAVKWLCVKHVCFSRSLTYFKLFSATFFYISGGVCVVNQRLAVRSWSVCCCWCSDVPSSAISVNSWLTTSDRHSTSPHSRPSSTPFSRSVCQHYPVTYSSRTEPTEWAAGWWRSGWSLLYVEMGCRSWEYRRRI